MSGVMFVFDMLVETDAFLIHFRTAGAAHETDLVQVFYFHLAPRFQFSKCVDDDSRDDADDNDVAEQNLK